MGTITTFHDHFLTIVDLFNRSFFIIVDRIIILIVDIDCGCRSYYYISVSIRAALNWLSNYIEEKDMLLYTFKKYVNRHIPDNEVYITTPEQSETNSDEFYVIDDNGPSTYKSTVEIEILNYINSKNTNLEC